MSEETYHGVPRSKILWDPTIDYEKCVSCGKCVDYCTLGVYEFEEAQGKKKPVVKNPNNCVVFCTGCEEQCPVGAIKFPSKKETRELIRKLQKQTKDSANRLKNKEVKKTVKQAYAKIATESDGCSCCSCGCGDQNAVQEISKSIGYSDEELCVVPEANLGLGCGNPTALGDLKEGDVVLDLGSGAGFDSFLAAKKVGPSGKVIGVDMTEEMVKKAKALAARYGCTNVEFRLGDIEKLPVESGSVDVVISNCVINLAPDKARVFSEAYRVLRNGGKMYVSDIVLLKELSHEQRNDSELLCGCVAGALLKDDYVREIERAGFDVKILAEDKEISERQYNGIALESLKLVATKSAKAHVST